MPSSLEAQLEPHLGVEGPSVLARDPVNQPMIRHWCDAIDDRNPVYTDGVAALACGFEQVVAPPTMLQAWAMRGLTPPDAAPSRPGPLGNVLQVLEGEGYTSVVATNCRQEYVRYLQPGDRISVTSRIESVSEEKQTGLGAGRFVTELQEYRDQHGEIVARMEFRILKFKPPRREAGAPTPESAPENVQRRRPRPAQSRDNAFFWEGIAAGELRIQRCVPCRKLRHPPGPMCPSCHSLAWDTLLASGRGHVFSFVVSHHPAIPPFEVPNLIVLVELEEGTRLVSNLVGVDPAEAEIGMPVEVVFTRVDPELVLPLFRPRTPE